MKLKTGAADGPAQVKERDVFKAKELSTRVGEKKLGGKNGLQHFT